MLDTLEKQELVTHSDDIFKSDEKALNFFKLLSNYMEVTTPLKKVLVRFDEKSLLDKSKFKNLTELIVKHMLETVEKVDTITYTTGELAKYFGVSTSAINNWINEGRFVNYEKPGKNKQARISENTLWKATNGKVISVKEVVEMWEEQNVTLTKDEELAIIKRELLAFENQYGGSYEETLNLIDNKDERQQRDDAEWRYLLRRVNNEERK